MALSKSLNRRLVSMTLLAAMLAFVVVFDIHTDDLQLCPQKQATGAVCEIVSGHQVSHSSHCAACEMMSMGTGNAVFTPVVSICSNTIQDTFVCDSLPAAASVFFCSFPSRASPV
ncbi:hypothetical protein LLG46_15305 [bacterium]|nr:hypothetical protein [bacterium]